MVVPAHLFQKVKVLQVHCPLGEIYEENWEDAVSVFIKIHMDILLPKEIFYPRDVNDAELSGEIVFELRDLQFRLRDV